MKKTTISIYMLFYVCVISACNLQQNDLFSSSKFYTATTTCPKTIPPLAVMPDFLMFVYPTESIPYATHKTDLSDSPPSSIYAKLSASISTSVLDSSDSNFRNTTMSNAVPLFVNNVLVSNYYLNLGDGLMEAGPFYYNWAVPLNTGYHTAKLVINTDTAETIEYEWSFCITP